MKFVLNTAIDPHFCAIFSRENKLLDKKVWTNRTKDGANIYEFLANQNPAKISFCGGVTGPGGFASLRASASVLTAISVANEIPIYQMSAEKWIAEFLGHENFLLNTFGQAVWTVQDGKISRKNLNTNFTAGLIPSSTCSSQEVIKSRDFLKNIDKTKPVVVEFLPDSKKELFVNPLKVSLDGLEESLLEALQKEKPQKTFVPHYEFPPVS